MTDAQANGLQVGLIGLGKMGRGIGRNLIKNGYPPAVADIDVEPVAELVSWGARDPGGVSELLADSDIVITCLPTPAANRTAYLGGDGFVALAKEGSVLVDCSTSDPLLAREIGIAAAARGVAHVDAPMLRTPKHAWEGTLHLVVGGTDEDFARVRPVLEAFSEAVVPVGGLGNGHAIKVINNTVNLGMTALICEAFNIGRAIGVDLTTLHKAMQTSNAASPKLDQMAPRIISGEHELTFSVDLALKDVDLFTQLANSVRAPSLVGDAARTSYLLASLADYGERNHSELSEYLRELTEGGDGQSDKT